MAELQAQLSTLRFENNIPLAHEDKPIVGFELQRSERARRLNQRANFFNTSLQRLQMAPAGQQLLCHAHQQQIVEGKPIAPASFCGWLDQPLPHPIANSIGRNCENSRRSTG